MNDELPIHELQAFLALHCPRLCDILANACELYRVDPDWIGQPFKLTNARADAASEMFMYCAGKFAGQKYMHTGELLGLDPKRASLAMGRFCKRLSSSEVLKDDFHLMAVRLTECILRQRRYG